MIVPENLPQTQEEYFAEVRKSKSGDDRALTVNYATAMKNLESLVSRCYTFDVEHYTRNTRLFKTTKEKQYTQKFTGRFKRFTPTRSGFTLQIMPGEGNISFKKTSESAKIPEGGMWVYGVEFRNENNKVIATKFAPWGWGGAADDVIDGAEGKFAPGNCPPSSKGDQAP